VAATGRLGEVRGFIGDLYGSDLHAKRIESLAGATLGVMAGASLAVAMIGQALAQARGLVTKHAVKQVDRLMSNTGIDVWDSFARWVPQQVGAIASRRADRGPSGGPDILVARDWTDFDHDGQSTLVLRLVTGYGRSAPLTWLTVWKEAIATRRNAYEDACLPRLADTVPPGCRVTVPCGPRRLTGVVLRSHDDPPGVETREAFRLLEAQPVLDQELLALGRWIAGYSCAPLGEVLRSMLPLASEIRRG